MTQNKTNRKKKYLFSQEVRTIIYQPNRVTKAVYDFSLIQEKVFNTVMYYLQEAILKRMKGEDYTQLSLFNNENNHDITFEIPLREITRLPQQYPYIKESLKELAGSVVTFPYYDENKNEKRIRYTGLFRADISENAKWTSTIRIEIDRHIAKFLIEVDLDKQRKPINYTKYIYEITKTAKNKYTPRIYKMICSWKKKGGFIISLNEFRNWMGIENKYKYYRDIKKYILVPTQEELMNKADCWFNCQQEDFTIKDRNQVTHLNFKVITPDFIKETEKQRDYIYYLLRLHFKFTDNEINQISPILLKTDNTTSILLKINYLHDYIQKNKIENITNYVLESLKKEFG
jgi:hypothetical protein